MSKLSKFYLFSTLIFSFFAFANVKAMETKPVINPLLPEKEIIKSEPLNNTQVLHLLAGFLKINKLKEIYKNHKEIFKACLNKPLGDKKQTLLMAVIESAKTPKNTDNSIKRIFVSNAIKTKKWDLVKLLIKYGADIFAKDSDGNTCLHLAIKTGDPKIVNYIMKAAHKKGPSRFLELLKTKNKTGQAAFELAKYLYESTPVNSEFSYKTIFSGLKDNYITNYIYDDPEIEEDFNRFQVWERIFDEYQTDLTKQIN